MEVKRTFDILEFALKTFDQEVALAGKVNKKWETYSNYEYFEIATNFSYGLLAMGLKPGDKVAMISNNRPEWNFADMGMSMAGIINVPIYPTLSIDEYEFIFKHAEPSLVLLSDQNLLKKIKPISDQAESITEVYTFNKVDGSKNWKEIVDLGKKNSSRFKDELNKIKAGIKKEDMVTLIYTSGTTGQPKV